MPPMQSAQHLLLAANTHARAGRFAEAAACMEDAAKLAPNDASVFLSLGMMRSTVNEMDRAEAAFLRAALLSPSSPEPHLYLAIILATQQRAADADAAFARADSLAPGRADVAHAWSRLLSDTARADEALAVIRRAQSHAPRDVTLQDKVCCLLNYLADARPEDVFAAHQEFGRLVGAPPPLHRVTDRGANRRLRIGYLSGDLREHSVSYFLESLLEHHDPAAFDVHCYHVGAPDDRVTPRLRSRVRNWRHLFPIGDVDLARAIANDGIDILVELAGHAQGNRLAAVALGPAPIIATFIGYPNTTGVPSVGYRIIDPLTDPPGSEQLATERLIHLNRCFLCYRPPVDAPAPRPRDADRPLTFGSFNNLAKLSPPTLDLWARVLARIPGSHIMLKGRGLGDPSVRDRILSRLVGAGISRERVELAGHTKTTAEHLSQYHAVDVALDPFPYAGTTTTCEALWMGVPVVTLAGRVHAGRVGVSLLNAAGLPELIAPDAAGYIETAASLATDPARLAALRADLRGRVSRSPLCDAPAHAAAVEAAYRSMWTGRL